MTATTNSQAADREIVITRLLSAPQQMVFDAFTNPQHLINWWGPNGNTNTFHKTEMHEGGEWRFTMHSPDGIDYPGVIKYQEITSPEKLVYLHGSGEEGEQPFHVTITFQPHGHKTLVTMRSLFATAALRDMLIREVKAIEAGNQTLDRLEQELSGMLAPATGDHAMVITRTVSAPRDLVYQAFTNANSLAQWWGPKGFAMDSLTLNLVPGGTFHYCMSAGDMKMWGKFVYKEIVAPYRIVFISSFSDQDGNIIRAPFSATWPLEVYNILTLTEHDGKTTITMRGWPVDATAEEQRMFRDMQPSMQQGFAGTFAQLDEFLNKS